MNEYDYSLPILDLFGGCRNTWAANNKPPRWEREGLGGHQMVRA
jgi:hypothetical protein